MVLLLVAAMQCGSEIPWKETMEEAAAEARKQKRPILWYVPQTADTTMDRKDLVDRYMMCGAWMMPSVIDLVNRKFVALKMIAGKNSWGVERIKFVEPGIVILSADGKLMYLLDGISTQNEEWLVQVLGSFVGEKPARSAPEGWRLDLKLGEYGKVAAALKDAASPEERYYLGAAQFLSGHSDEAVRTWREVRETRWAWKAAAEADNVGPLVHGFESLAALPDDAFGKPPRSTHLSRKEADVPRAVRWLLSHQKSNGAWDDNTYVFGGADSVPNVNVAVTAIVASALMEHRDADPKGVDAALERAWVYLLDEKNTAPGDEDEYLWALTYRLEALARKGGAVEKMNELIKLLESRQAKTGSFRHEYHNPFATASSILALERAKAAGATVAPETIKKAAEWLDKKRDDKGTFSYDASGTGARVEGSAGRMPLCELALLAGGLTSAKRVQQAVDEGFAHHARLEAVRKFDDHTDAFHNGGFFFWYDLDGRARAIDVLKGSTRDKYRAALRAQVLEIGEIDGSWVDSHELGKSYGTAMALLVLKGTGGEPRRK